MDFPIFQSSGGDANKLTWTVSYAGDTTLASGTLVRVLINSIIVHPYALDGKLTRNFSPINDGDLPLNLDNYQFDISLSNVTAIIVGYTEPQQQSTFTTRDELEKLYGTFPEHTAVKVGNKFGFVSWSKQTLGLSKYVSYSLEPVADANVVFKMIDTTHQMTIYTDRTSNELARAVWRFLLDARTKISSPLPIPKVSPMKITYDRIRWLINSSGYSCYVIDYGNRQPIHLSESLLRSPTPLASSSSSSSSTTLSFHNTVLDTITSTWDSGDTEIDIKLDDKLSESITDTLPDKLAGYASITNLGATDSVLIIGPDCKLSPKEFNDNCIVFAVRRQKRLSIFVASTHTFYDDNGADIEYIVGRALFVNFGEQIAQLNSWTPQLVKELQKEMLSTGSGDEDRLTKLRTRLCSLIFSGSIDLIKLYIPSGMSRTNIADMLSAAVICHLDTTSSTINTTSSKSKIIPIRKLDFALADSSESYTLFPEKEGAPTVVKKEQ